MSATNTTTATTLEKDRDSILHNISGFGSKPRKLIKIDNSGKLYVPAFIRKLFEGYHFYPYIENGKLVFDPVKVEDGFPEEVDEFED